MLRALGYGSLASALTGFTGYLYGTRVETQRLQLEKAQVRLRNLGSGLDGFKIALLSDFHLYPHTQIELIKRAVDMANRLKPDLVALVGDFVLSTADSIFDLAPVLAGLNAKYGVFSVLGNHDHWKNDLVVSRGLESCGLPVLRNSGVTLSVGRDRMFVAGLDDGWVRRSNLTQALERRPEGLHTILLMHEPDFADQFCNDGRVSLQLSGHSHGGQVRLPLVGSPFLPRYGRKYDQGLYRVRNMWLYTTRGVGVTAPIRLNCPPEVTEITLIADN